MITLNWLDSQISTLSAQCQCQCAVPGAQCTERQAAGGVWRDEYEGEGNKRSIVDVMTQNGQVSRSAYEFAGQVPIERR